MMANTIYVLCVLTSLACAIMLIRGWLKSRARFLMWCALCFTCLALNNAMLFIDRAVYPDDTLHIVGIELGILRGSTTVIGFALLFWGLIWDLDRSRARRSAQEERV